MKIAGIFTAALICSPFAGAGAADFNTTTLWYSRPGTEAPLKGPDNRGQNWMSNALPIGNGELGCLILGGVEHEDISFTEKTLWSGSKEMHGASNYSGYGCFELFGNLYIDILNNGDFGWESSSSQPQDYLRTLDMADATATVSFKSPDGNVAYTRQFIASAPDNVIAMKFTADRPGAISLLFSVLPGMAENHEVTYSDNEITFGGKLETVSYNTIIKIIPSGGSMSHDDNGISVTAADSMLIYLTAGTDYDPDSPSYTSGTENLVANQQAVIANAEAKGWTAILADHVADHKSYFDRMALTIGTPVNNLPTDQLIEAYRDGTATSSQARMLEQLYFDYGRYLGIASNRYRNLPNNLQGIWTGFGRNNWYIADYTVQPWNADIHANINIQMNYWPMEPTNLSDLHLPLLNYIISQATEQPQWRENVAKYNGGTKGWTTYTENGIFGNSSSWFNNYVVANAWYCTHLWNHYRYTLDKEFLAKAFPAMWSACEFWFERLKKAADGTYECPDEFSPEQGPTQDAVAHAQQLVAELFANTLDAAEALGDDSPLTPQQVATLKNYYGNLDKGLATEEFMTDSGWTPNGLKDHDKLLKEWKYSDYTVGQNGHRHMSQLMALYPFNQVTPGTEYFDAAVNSLRQRGDEATGWSLGWKVNLWARALDGQHAHTIFSNALKRNIYDNLFDAHPPFQIDGNFGVTSGVCEMILQGHNGYLHFLPALPAEWSEGSVKGLKAIGNFTVDMTWANGELQEAAIISNAGAPLNLRPEDVKGMAITLNGNAITPKQNANGLIEIPTRKGDSIILTKR